MGCSPGDADCYAEEKPVHRVTITRPFEMSKFQLRQQDYEAVMNINPSNFKGPNLPVENVSWDDAQRFCEAVNGKGDGYRYRLPTEAEWEYAARAGDPSSRYGPLLQVAWFRDNSGGTTHPVGEKHPNAFGLYDTLGNVWEWVQDWYDPKYYRDSPMADPKGPNTDAAEGGRVVRGGSFHDDGPWLTRVSLRQHFLEDYKHFDLGFRVVREKR